MTKTLIFCLSALLVVASLAFGSRAQATVEGACAGIELYHLPERQQNAVDAYHASGISYEELIEILEFYQDCERQLLVAEMLAEDFGNSRPHNAVLIPGRKPKHVKTPAVIIPRAKPKKIPVGTERTDGY